MSVRSRSHVVGVGVGVAPTSVAPTSVAPTSVGLESRLAQVLSVGQRTFGHQTDATGGKQKKPGPSGRQTPGLSWRQKQKMLQAGEGLRHLCTVSCFLSMLRQVQVLVKASE